MNSDFFLCGIQHQFTCPLSRDEKCVRFQESPQTLYTCGKQPRLISQSMRSLRYTSNLIKVFPIVLCRINGEFCEIVLWIDHDSCQNRWHQL